MNRKMIGEAIYIRVSDRKSNPIATKRGNVLTQSWRSKSAVFRMHSSPTSHGYSKSVKAVRRQRNLGLRLHENNCIVYNIGMCYMILCMLTFRSFRYKKFSYVMVSMIGLNVSMQGFQSGPVPGTFTRLRSCIVPVEITEPPKISGGQNHKYDGR